MSAKRYKRPDLKAETLSAISSELLFASGRISYTGLENHFLPGTVDPAIYYEEARVNHGVQLHSILLKVPVEALSMAGLAAGFKAFWHTTH